MQSGQPWNYTHINNKHKLSRLFLIHLCISLCNTNSHRERGHQVEKAQKLTGHIGGIEGRDTEGVHVKKEKGGSATIIF